MLTTVQLIDRICAQYKCNDSGAARLLGLTRSAISSARGKKQSIFDDDTAIKAADLLQLPHEQVLLGIQHERAKLPEVKRAWQRVADAMKSAAAMLALVIAASVAMPSPVHAAAGDAMTSPLYIMSNRRRMIWHSIYRFILYRLRPLLLIVPIVVTACGQDANSASSPTDAAAPQVACTYSGPTGICVAFADAKAADIPAIDYERAYRFVEHCMYDNYAVPGAPGPVVRVLSEMFTVDGKPVAGYTDFSTGAIRAVGFGTVYHEYVHYLLLRAGFPNDANANHEHPGFLTCGARAGLSDN